MKQYQFTVSTGVVLLLVQLAEDSKRMYPLLDVQNFENGSYFHGRVHAEDEQQAKQILTSCIWEALLTDEEKYEFDARTALIRELI